MAAFLDARMEDANSDAAFISKALGDIARAKGMVQVARDAASLAKAYTRHFPVSGVLILMPSSRLSERWG